MVETRVEKYREYRREIQNSFSEKDLTTKKKTSDRVNKILSGNSSKRDSTNSISYNEIMGAYEIYDKDQKKESSPLEKKHRRKVAYVIFATIMSILLITSTVIVGIIAFGGK